MSTIATLNGNTPKTMTQAISGSETVVFPGALRNGIVWCDASWTLQIGDGAAVPFAADEKVALGPTSLTEVTITATGNFYAVYEPEVA